MATIRETKRRGSKAMAAVEPARVKMSASVKPDTYLRLATHALHLGQTQGELIDELVKTHLRRFQVRDMERAKGSDEDDDRQDLAGGESDSGEAAAA